jgi:hypothetical protein
MPNQSPLIEKLQQFPPKTGIDQVLGVPTQEIMLTTLANGMKNGKLRISVAVAPRLRPIADAPLSLFPNFLDWPKFVATLKFKVLIGPSPDRAIAFDAEPLWSSATLDSPLWTSLFPPTTPVHPYPQDKDGCQPKYEFKPIVVERPFFQGVIKEHIYQAVAVGEIVAQRLKMDAFTQLPTSSVLQQQLERAGILVRDPSLGGKLNVGFVNPLVKLDTVNQQLQKSLPQAPGGGLNLPPRISPGGPAITPRGLGTGSSRTMPRLVPPTQLESATGIRPEQLHFLEFQVSKQLLALPPERIAPKFEAVDFHQIVSHLAEYPQIMRRLGLTLDFQVTVDLSKLPPSSTIWVRPVVDAAAAGQFISPRSQFELNPDAGVFRLKPNSSDSLVENGCLKFGRTTGPWTFDVVPGDVEGAAEKLEKFAQMVLDAGPSLDQQNDGALPALRSGGLAVAQRNRDYWLKGIVETLNNLHCTLALEREQIPNFPPDRRGTTVLLGMEQVIRGLRIDVRELFENAPPGPWRSLCFRRGHYLVGPAQQPVLNIQDDEGWVSLGSMKPTVPTAPPTLLIYESLFRWNGWSLAVPRPGKAHGEDGPGSPSLAGTNMIVRFDPVPGTLPKLRFGRHYQFRARVVDLAGNGLSVNDLPNPANELVTSAQDGYYDRFEPVSSPILVLKYPLLGPSTPSCPQGQPLAPGESVARLVIRTANTDGRGTPAGPANQASTRHLVPPRVAQDLAEAHGMFDDPVTGKFRPDAYLVMTSKDRTLSTTSPATPGFGPDGKPRFEDVHPEESFTVPYLPDPLAAGVTFFNLPGTAGTQFVTQIPFQGSWPDRTSFQLQLEPGTGAPVLSGNVLRVFLPPGEQLVVQLSSHFAPGQETLMAVWRWILEAAVKNPSVNLQQIQTLVRTGRHWMITPFREIVLVHATQQPVMTPRWVSLVVSPQRQPGQTAASLSGMVDLHSPSTQKLDLVANWIDPIDEGTWPDNPPPDPSGNPYSFLFVKKNSVAFETQVPPDGHGAGCGMAPPYSLLLPGLFEERLAARLTVRRRSIEGAEFEAPQPGESPAEAAPEAPASEKEIRERGLSGGVLRRPEISPPIQMQPAQPPSQKMLTPGMADRFLSPGRPPYDESPFRCAPPPPNPPQRTPNTFDFCGTHQFGDTKYRCVEYSALATTRYREYFYPLPDFPDCPPRNSPVEPQFTRTSAPIKVDILSSAPPAAPKPLYIVPTLRWEDTPQGRRRVGGGIRIYLERPWFSSGLGEQLAVVLYGHDYPTIMEQAKPYVTQWGLDPLWVGGEPTTRFDPTIGALKESIVPSVVTPRSVDEQPTERGISQLGAAPILKESAGAVLKQMAGSWGETAGATYPQPVHFRNPAAVREDLVVAEVVGRWPIIITTPSGGKASQVPSQATPLPVKICAFNVLPDHSRQLWYCDIEMDPGTAYFPFVRLALARYQVNAIPGAHLSPIVLADFAQLMPDRVASVVVNPANPTKATVSVSGVIGVVPPVRSSAVEVQVEQFNPAFPGELGWGPVPNVQPVVLPLASPQQWAGEIALPPPGGPTQYRLVIREYEIFTISEAGAPLRREERRLIYADVLPLKR